MSAQAYKKAGFSFRAPCQDTLDCACRSHDRDCAHDLGCSAKGDRKLAAVATFVALTTKNVMLRDKALILAGAITAASFRRNR